MNKLFYFEFLLPIADYFKTLKFNEFIYEILVPFAVAVVVYFKLLCPPFISGISEYFSSILTLLAILIGFSIASLTIFASNSSSNIEDLKEAMSERKIKGEKISLFRLIIITFIFALIMEFVGLIFNLSYGLLFKTGHFKNFIEEYYAINIFLLLHIFLLNIRNITNFYFIFYRK